MLSDDVKNVVFSYLTQLRVTAVNAEILRLRKAVIKRMIREGMLKERWEEWVLYESCHSLYPEVYGPEAKYGAEDLVSQGLTKAWFFIFVKKNDDQKYTQK